MCSHYRGASFMVHFRKCQLAWSACAVLLTACGGGGGGGGGDKNTDTDPPQPNDNGLTISATVAPNETSQIGDLEKGWLMRIPEGAFGDQPITVEMNTATALDLRQLNAPEGARVLSLSANGQHNLRLKAPVEIATPIPAGVQPWALMYGYHTTQGWEFWPFKEVDLTNSVAVIEVQHFSWLWGNAQPTKQERLKVYGRTMAAQYTQQELARQALQQKIGPDLDKTLASLGITDRAVAKDLAMNVISYLESAHISDEYAFTANAALSPIESIATIASGDEEQRNTKSLEVVAKALHWALARGGPDKWQAAGIASLGSLGEAAGALAGGDSAAAGPAVYSVLKGLVTTGAPGAALPFMVVEAAVGVAQNAVDAFTASELEKAYQIYIGASSGKGYYETGSGNVGALLEEMAGGGRQQEVRIIANYCEKRMIRPCDLSEREHQLALEKGRASLKAYFEQRKNNEAIYKTFEDQENAFLAELENDKFLLVEGFYKDYFKDDSDTFNLEERLQRIYKIRDSLRKLFDGSNAAKMTPRDMVLAIRFWMSTSVEKKRTDFYDWARAQGYISTSLAPEEQEPPVTPPSTNLDGEYNGYLLVDGGLISECHFYFDKKITILISGEEMSGDLEANGRLYGQVTGNTFTGEVSRSGLLISGTINPPSLSRFIGNGAWETENKRCTGTFALEKR
ncbi:Hypothetical protein HDN1F_21850 [gamma proteobacterium HdN1]|nr:Hypothetical protein HDN1F_21850 [gamma proteobacterium HdN1]